MSRKRILSTFVIVVLIILGILGLSSSLSASSHETLIVQLRKVELIDIREGLLDEQDLETKWAMIVVHDDQLTTEIEYPGNTFIPAREGDVIEFGTRMGHPQDLNNDKDELIIFFVGVDIDDETLEDFDEYTLPVQNENFSSSSPANSAIGSIISRAINAEENWDSLAEYDWRKVANATAQGIELGSPSFLRRISDYAPETLNALTTAIGSPFVGMAIGIAVDIGIDETVDFFKQHDEIDSAAIILRRSEDWNVGTHTVLSSNGSLKFTYEVSLVVDAQLEVTNNTLTHLCGVYVTQGETTSSNSGFIDDTSNRLTQPALAPGETTVFDLAATGDYSNQVYDCYDQLSGQSTRSVTNNNKINWTISQAHFAITNKTSEDICFIKVEDAETDAFLMDILHYSKLPPEHSVIMIGFDEADRYRFTAETCDGIILDSLSAQPIFFEDRVTHWSLTKADFSNEYLLVLRNNTDNDICDLAITTENSVVVSLPLDNEFITRKLDQDGQEMIRLQEGNYEVVAETCDGTPLSYSINLDDTMVLPLE